MNINAFIPVYEEKRRFTLPEFFDEIINTVRQIFFTDEAKLCVFDGKLELDYCQAEQYQWYSKEKIRDIEFDVECVAHFGSCEGIYIEVSLRGDLGIEPDPEDGRRYYIGTLKTLSADFDAMRACGELAGTITAVGRKLICLNSKNFLATKSNERRSIKNG